MGVDQVQGKGSSRLGLGRKVVGLFINAWGRVVTVIGTIFASIDVFDIAPAQQPLADLIGEPQAKKVIGAGALVCLVLSFVRHQLVANKYKALQRQLSEKP